MRRTDYEATFETPPEVAREVVYIAWGNRALDLGHMPDDAPAWVRERWEAERAEVEATVGPLAHGARKFQDRMIEDVLKGEFE